MAEALPVVTLFRKEYADFAVQRFGGPSATFLCVMPSKQILMALTSAAATCDSANAGT